MKPLILMPQITNSSPAAAAADIIVWKFFCQVLKRKSIDFGIDKYIDVVARISPLRITPI